MADFDIDQEKLPGVKEVVRDFAVLEDHCLAHNLQEQEIESHLASNINRSRLVQQDLAVAKKLQEEEDHHAKKKAQKQHQELEQIDSEIAQEIQEQLVWQAELQRKQEEKDELIARKLHEREMKEEKKRKKQLEAAKLEEESREYYDEKARRVPSDSGYPSPERSGAKVPAAGRGRYPDYDPPLIHGDQRRGRHADYCEGEEGGPAVRRKDRPTRPPPPSYDSHRDRNANRDRDRDEDRRRERERDRYRERDRDGEATRPRQRAWSRDGLEGEREGERRRERDRHRGGGEERSRQRAWSQDRLDEWESGRGRDRDRLRDGDLHATEREADRHVHRGPDASRERDGHRDADRGRHHSRDQYESKEGYREQERDREREREKRLHNGRTRSRERELESRLRSWSGEEDSRFRLRLPSGAGGEEVFEEANMPRSPRSPRSPRGGVDRRGALDLDDDVRGGLSPKEPHPPTGSTSLDRGRGGRGEFGVPEVQQGMSRLALREQELALREQELQELRDLEVAKRIQEEELKASNMGRKAAQAAQVAQDEEIARMLMEEEKKVFKKARDREREKQPVVDRRKPEGDYMERRKPDGDYRPSQEEVVRPRSREEYEQQRARNHKQPSRPPPPRSADYVNVESNYGYPAPHYPPRPEAHYPPRAAARPDPYKGGYYKQ
ncbi:coiled-coil domain-containing protein 50 [Engraulis encrasicolus]|uniref:coiled-coil domain-containing protein 50 n=1 Tax=Engraulis encrasicolus TaxID=184585 RepID=UPI002FD0C335